MASSNDVAGFVRCPSCGQFGDPGRAFCGSCGQPLAPLPPPDSHPAPSYPPAAYAAPPPAYAQPPPPRRGRGRALFVLVAIVLIVVVLLVVLLAVPFATSRAYSLNCYYPGTKQPETNFSQSVTLPGTTVQITWTSNVEVTMYVLTGPQTFSNPVYQSSGTAENGSGSFSVSSGTYSLFCQTSSLGYTATPSASVTLDFSTPLL